MDPGAVHIWTVPLDIPSSGHARRLELLSADERDRAWRFRHDRHRAAYVACRAALRSILGGYLGEGSAIATAMIPFLLGCILISWFGLQRRKWQQGEAND